MVQAGMAKNRRKFFYMRGYGESATLLSYADLDRETPCAETPVHAKALCSL